MEDLRLYRLLGEDDPDPKALVPLLAALAERPLVVRAPWLGRIGPSLRHPSASVRAAAVRALRGATGPNAVAAILRGLDDGDPTVRAAASEAMLATAQLQPRRIVHIVFHPEADVREAAYDADLHSDSKAIAAHRLADPDFDGSLASLGIEPTTTTLELVMSLVADGRVPAEDARAWLCSSDPKVQIAWTSAAPRRTSQEMGRILETRGAELVGSDRLDALFRLFGEDATADHRVVFYAGWSRLLSTSADAFIRRAVASLVFVAGEWTEEALGLAVSHFPMLLSWASIPRVARRAAVDAIYRNGPRRSVPPMLLTMIVKSDIGQTKKRVDLRVVGALPLFLTSARYEWLVEQLGLETICRAFLADPEDAAPFLSVPDSSKKGRRWMLDRILERAKTDAAYVHAIAAAVGEAKDITFLSAAPPASRVSIVKHLLALEQRPGLAFGAKHANAIATAVLSKHSLGTETELLARWVERPDYASSELGPRLLKTLASSVSPVVLGLRVAALETQLLRRVLEIIDRGGLLGYAPERAIAKELYEHPSTVIAEWAEERRPRLSTGAPPVAFEPPSTVQDLEPEIAKAIAHDADVLPPIRLCVARPIRGLVQALRDRAAPPKPSVEVALALLGCYDAPADVASLFERWSSATQAFVEELDARAVSVAARHPNPPLLMQCWLWRFERHGLAAGKEMVDSGLTSSLTLASTLPSAWLARQMWAAAARTLAVWCRRTPEKLRAVVNGVETLLDLALDKLDRDEGLYAARLIRAIFDARIAPGAIEARRLEIARRLPDIADETRRELRDIISSDGLPSRAAGARADLGRAGQDELDEIRTSSDLDALERRCHGDVLRTVHEAALRLLSFAEPGRARLAELLVKEPAPLHFDALTASLPLWDEGAALQRVRRHLAAGHGTAELRFRIALAFVERREPMLDVAIDAACAPSEESWLQRADADRLVALTEYPDPLMRRLALSPHAPAYLLAVRHMTSRVMHDDDDITALRAFLELGTERMTDLRWRAAHWLRKRGDEHGLPILIALALARHEGVPRSGVLADVDESVVRATVEGALLCGGHDPESLTLGWLDDVEAGLREEMLQRFLGEAMSLPIRSKALTQLPRRPTRAKKLRVIAEVFAWGLSVSRELTGSALRPHMISGNALGYTRLNENRVFVSPMPMLRGDRHGRAIVEGLVLHEIGHHRHHKGVEEAAVWRKADSVGLGRLLNLIADEHLERNLRAYDEDFGNKLKRLDAYAFQHAEREVDVHILLDALAGRAFDVLTNCALSAALDEQAVRVETAAIMRELEQRRSSFARFCRALRMGLGNRHGDEKVEEALALFGKSFRKESMPGLWRITKEVHRIFGDEVRLSFAFGGAESLESDPYGNVTEGEEIGDDDVQREVERILGAPDASTEGGSGRNKGRLQINVGGDDSFPLIHNIVKVDPDPARHREVARSVSRHSRRLRLYLTKLGLALEPQRMRLRGRRLDRTRINPLVTRGDPRFLVARETRWRNDLFLGLVIDCSGSMQGQSMERAHAFGVLLAEAVRGLRGVECRIFGFTDREIFDAGDARRPAVTSLTATTGNNDAAGLHHAAQVALRSHRRAKVLVMISDGLPTECSVAALRGLVRQLTRRHGLVCAQVAVRPLEEICFPHYVEVDEANLDGAVARFGQIVARLVGNTLRSST